VLGSASAGSLLLVEDRIEVAERLHAAAACVGLAVAHVATFDEVDVVARHVVVPSCAAVRLGFDRGRGVTIGASIRVALPDAALIVYSSTSPRWMWEAAAQLGLAAFRRRANTDDLCNKVIPSLARAASGVVALREMDLAMPDDAGEGTPLGPVDLDLLLASLSECLIRFALDRSPSKRAAAATLKLSDRTLRDRMRKYSIPSPRHMRLRKR